MMKNWIRKLFSTSSNQTTPRGQQLNLLTLEDRTTPTVSATKSAVGLLTINYSAANDSATIQARSGGIIRLTGTGFSQTDFTGVTAINVSDTFGRSGQVLNVTNDFFQTITLSGAFNVTDIEVVSFALTDGPLSAGSIFIERAQSVQVNATSPGIVLPQLSSSGEIRIVAAGSGSAIGDVGGRAFGINGGSKLLVTNTTGGNGNQFLNIGGGIRNVDGQQDAVDAGTGTITLTNGQLFGLGNGDFGDRTTFHLGTGGIMTVFNSEKIGGLTGTGLVGASAGGTQTLIVGNGSTSTQFDGSLRDVAGTPSGPNGKLALATDGTGTFTLNGANTFTGGVTVNTGSTLRLLGSSADRLAAKSNVTVNAGGTLEIAATNPTPTGTNSLNLTLNGGTYQLTGASNSGTHLNTVAFSNGGTIKANGTIASFAGYNAVLNGNVSVTGSSDPTINLPNGIGLGSTSTTFNVATGRTLSLSSTTGLFDADAVTPNSLIKQGAGTLRIDGTIHLSRNGASNSGNITVSDGTLLINGTMTNGAAATDVVVNGTGILGGVGNIQGTVSVQSGAKLQPGNTATGTLSTGDISFSSGSTFAVRVNGGTAGTFDSLAVTGTVNLGNATFSFADTNTANTITIITNDGNEAVQGTFAGLPEGATVTGSKGTYILSYKGGDGNDVTLTRVIAGPYIVDNTGDAFDGIFSAGNLTLREAIFLANANPGPDTISFANGLGNIVLTSAELSITDKTGATTITGPTTGTQVVTRSSVNGTPEFRIFNISSGVTANLSGLTISNGSLSGGQTGGGILNAGTLTLANSTISGNKTTNGNGGGGVFNNGTMTVTNSTVSGNSTQGSGGGLNNFGNASIVNSTFSGNTSGFNGNSGGGIFHFQSPATLNVSNSTIFGNIRGGIRSFSTGQVTLTNTIVSGNFDGATFFDVAGALVTISSNNLIGVDSNLSGITNGTNGNLIGTAGTPLDAKLGSLANNNGPTQTHALLPDSPALNGGSNIGVPGQDARGFARVAGANVDIGAYEVQTVTIVPTTLPNANVGIAYNQSITASFVGQPTGTTYTFSAITPLPSGLSLSPQGVISGIPSGAGNSLFAVLATASTGDFVQTNISLTTITNTPPVARDDFATTTKATAVTIDILANDTDEDGDPLTVVVGNAANGTVTFINGKAIYTPNAQFVGEDFFGYTITDGKGGPPATARATITVSALPVVPPVSPPPPVRPPLTGAARENLVGSKQFAVGSGEGGSTATLHNADNSVRFTITPFPGQTGGVRVAVADFDQDGIGDLVVGTGPGGPTEVKVFNGKTQALMFQINPFEAAFTGGVFVAAGSLTGEFGADLAISPDEGGGPRVRLFGGIGAGQAFQVADFFGIEDPNFRGGARVAMGDINGDTKADLVVAAGFGGGPRIAAFSGASFFGTPDRPVKLFGDFLAFENALRNGTFVAVGDVDGDGRAELIAGGGPGGGPRVSVFTGVDLLRNVQTRQADFFAGTPVNRGGVRLAASDLDGDGRADLVTGSGPGVSNQVVNYFATSLTSRLPEPASFFEVSLGLSGVFVG